MSMCVHVHVLCARACIGKRTQNVTDCHTEGIGIRIDLVFSFILFYIFLTSIEHLYLFYNMNKAIKKISKEKQVKKKKPNQGVKTQTRVHSEAKTNILYGQVTHLELDFLTVDE